MPITDYVNIVNVVESIMSQRQAFDHHGPRVSVFAMALGNACARLSTEEIEMIGVAGSLHDIGKLSVDDTILNAPTSLSRNQMRRVRLHPRAGYEMMLALDYHPIVLDCALHHHEHWDGGGYPDGLKGDEISIHSRIMCIVDVYDAMTSARAYRSAKRHEYAMAEMLTLAGIWFDPELVQLFFDKVVTHG